MGHLVRLALHGSTLPILVEEDEEEAFELVSKNRIPLFWMALLDGRDLTGAWEKELRGCFVDPDVFGDELPAIAISWSEAEARLRRAEKQAERRVPSLAGPLREWAAALRRVARRGGAHEVRLELSTLWQMYNDADQVLHDLHGMIDVWHGQRAVAEAVGRERRDALTGFDQATGAPFPASIAAWQAGRPVPGYSGAKRGWRQNVADWGMALLFAAGVIGGWALGRSQGGGTAGWIGGTFGLVASCLITWTWVRSRTPDRTDQRAPSPHP